MKGSAVLKAIDVPIDEIYVPAERRKERDADKVAAAAAALLDGAAQKPLQVRLGKDRYVLVRGVNRLEAARELGELTVPAFVVGARQH